MRSALMMQYSSLSSRVTESKRSMEYEDGLSLILATVGRTKEIGRFLESIAASVRESIEVILVDQNHDDRLLEVVNSALAKGFDLTHVRLSRRGLSYARNVGLSKARYNLIGFPDDDCWYERSACEAVRTGFQSDGQLDGIVVRWVERHDDLIDQTMLDENQQRDFRGIPIASICLFFRTASLQVAGGFDERLGIGEWFGSSEETDLVLRMLHLGHRITYCPKISVHHFWGGSSIDLSGDIWSLYRRAKFRARGTGAIYAKHSLSKRIVLKGVLAPLFKAALMRDGIRGVVYWTGTAIGRLQGLINWK